jgi:hypothetical protein
MQKSAQMNMYNKVIKIPLMLNKHIYQMSNARDTTNFTTKYLQTHMALTWHNATSAIKTTCQH